MVDNKTKMLPENAGCIQTNIMSSFIVYIFHFPENPGYNS